VPLLWAAPPRPPAELILAQAGDGVCVGWNSIVKGRALGDATQNGELLPNDLPPPSGPGFTAPRAASSV
jgi:hypothetical protein